VAKAEKAPDSPRLIGGVKLKIKVRGEADERFLRAMWRKTEANCPVLAIFREFTPVKVKLELIPQRS